MILKLLIALLLIGLDGSVQASDNLREQNYAASIEHNPLIGKIVWLNAGEQKFLSLFTEAEKSKNQNAVIILHEAGEYPDQKPLVHWLRILLPQHNWATLALQMPLRENASSAADYYPLFTEAQNRIKAAIEYLKANGAVNIALIGYGLGALMATNAVNDHPDNIGAIATVSLSVPVTDNPQLQTLAFIKNIGLPFLDVYAEFDLAEVVDSARQRRMAGKDNPVYRQVRLIGENHAIQEDHEQLIKLLYSWLDTSFQPK